jgi:hypothetical protein
VSRTAQKWAMKNCFRDLSKGSFVAPSRKVSQTTMEWPTNFNIESPTRRRLQKGLHFLIWKWRVAARLSASRDLRAAERSQDWDEREGVPSSGVANFDVIRMTIAFALQEARLGEAIVWP